MTVYIETSAAAKLLVADEESPALSAYLDNQDSKDVMLLSSHLLETALRRLATRHEVPQTRASDVLDRIMLLEPDRAIYTAAGLLPGRDLRSLDALHVAVALRAEAEVMLTYDTRQASAARAAGLAIMSPSRDSPEPSRPDVDHSQP